MKNKESKISVVIPALNEEKGIGPAIDQIPVAKLNEMGYEVEILVVDNGSKDKTAQMATEKGARVIHQPIRGYGNAYKAGFDNATGDIIATGDADMTYPFDALPGLLEYLNRENIEFLSTDRLTKLNNKAMTFSHIFGNWLLSSVTRLLFRWPYKDSQSGMWIFRRYIWPQIDVRSGYMPFSQELKLEAFAKGFVCAETPIEYRPRVGEVKLNATKDGLRNMTQLFLKRFSISSQRLRSKSE